MTGKDFSKKLNPDKDCPPHCEWRDDLCSKVNGCTIQKEWKKAKERIFDPNDW